MEKIDEQFLDGITEKAKASPRLRYSYDLRDSENDQSQRVLNALEPGTVVPVHRHRHSSEVVFVLRGKLRLVTYDEDARLVSSDIFSTGETVIGYTVPRGTWHTVECLETGTVLYESKEGAYEPLQKNDILKFD